MQSQASSKLMRSGNWTTFTCVMPKHKKTTMLATVPLLMLQAVSSGISSSRFPWSSTLVRMKSTVRVWARQEKVPVPAGILDLPLQAVAAWVYHPATPPGRPCPQAQETMALASQHPWIQPPAWCLVLAPPPCPLTPHTKSPQDHCTKDAGSESQC